MAVLIIGAGGVWISGMGKNQGGNIAPNPLPDTSLFASPVTRTDRGSGEFSVGNSATPEARPKLYVQAPSPYPQSELANKKAVIVTDRGTIELKIYPDTPIASSNFIFLASHHFYDGLTFHRVVPGFVIQGGDPNGDGTGGPGYTLREANIKGDYSQGVVAWAKTASEPAGTAGSQFFIMLDKHPLPPDYASFGQVISGMDVVQKIQVGDKIQKVTVAPLR